MPGECDLALCLRTVTAALLVVIGDAEDRSWNLGDVGGQTDDVRQTDLVQLQLLAGLSPIRSVSVDRDEHCVARDTQDHRFT